MCFLREPALLLLLLVYLCDGKSVLKADDEDHRDSKFLNLFTRITFANTNCTGENGDEGTCYTAKECRLKGGTISTKPCAQGFGVCCIFFKTCQGSTSEQVAYFQNPKYPEPETARNKACMFQLTVPHKDFCQVRLDFDNFELAEPNMPDGTKSAKCRDDDSFVIEGGHEINPLNLDHVELCGNNTGQHLYVHLNTSAVPITFTLFVQADTTPYKWKIKTTMIDCTKESRLKDLLVCYSGQFILNFKSNDEDNGDGQGFQLKYIQQPTCDPSC
ncbi:unnamed protein product [Darwinula stevensoni]|uniref:CUB domain-containing protein n=1 Tax=Darwinula stevensoni TaxID=69355 RepID=A0A7R8XHD6_9CRUS|nr:unnamed protein product [Darwinula stevensoni]CAG0892440.1 unnamed protein product [Darwinula stevensoni]